MRATIQTDNQSRSENSHVWMKAPDKYRIEQSAGARKVITIANGADLWQVDTLKKSCEHRKDADTVRKMSKQTLDGVNLLDAFKKRGGKRVRQAKIDGALCTLYQRKDKAGMTYMIWALPNGHVRRIATSGTMTGASAMGEEVLTHQLESRADIKWLDGKTMDEALFQPPAGMQITEARSK
jgi:outer membrane lipoprotein-sorting protein